MHPGQALAQRLQKIAFLKKIGFQVGIGNIVGLPDQTVEDLADEILFFKECSPDMIGISPFIAQKDTPLKSHPSPSFELVLRFLALTRIHAETAHIPSSTAVATLNKKQGTCWHYKSVAMSLWLITRQALSAVLHDLRWPRTAFFTRRRNDDC